jgi:hypothetical protein
MKTDFFPSGETIPLTLAGLAAPVAGGVVTPKSASFGAVRREPSVGLINTYSLPLAVKTRYQKRPSGKNVGLTPARSTSAEVLPASILTARS